MIIKPAGLSKTLTTCKFWCLPSNVFTSRRQSLKWSSCCSSIQVFRASCGLLIPAWRTVARTFGTEAKRCKENRFHLLGFLKFISWFIIWPVRTRAQFPWKTIWKKVPYEGRTPRSSRAGKSRTALLEKRTAPLLPQDDGIGTSWFHSFEFRWTIVKIFLKSKECPTCLLKLYYLESDVVCRRKN